MLTAPLQESSGPCLGSRDPPRSNLGLFAQRTGTLVAFQQVDRRAYRRSRAAERSAHWWRWRWRGWRGDLSASPRGVHQQDDDRRRHGHNCHQAHKENEEFWRADVHHPGTLQLPRRPPLAIAWCSQSPKRHATAHWTQHHDHSRIRPYGPDEYWGRCYPDQTMFEADGVAPSPSHPRCDDRASWACRSIPLTDGVGSWGPTNGASDDEIHGLW